MTTEPPSSKKYDPTLSTHLVARARELTAGTDGEFPLPDMRAVDLAIRLIAPGPKAAAVSASECHEITESVITAYDRDAFPVRAREALITLADQLETLDARSTEPDRELTSQLEIAARAERDEARQVSASSQAGSSRSTARPQPSAGKARSSTAEQAVKVTDDQIRMRRAELAVLISELESERYDCALALGGDALREGTGPRDEVARERLAAAWSVRRESTPTITLTIPADLSEDVARAVEMLATSYHNTKTGHDPEDIETLHRDADRLDALAESIRSRSKES